MIQKKVGNDQLGRELQAYRVELTNAIGEVQILSDLAVRRLNWVLKLIGYLEEATRKPKGGRMMARRRRSTMVRRARA